MREVNFSIPNANKASVGITTALYDRRALDCTSTLPLINSLNNLAYLTTSSGRIRDILTVDGGIERLVCILKEGRSKDMMEMWKWNLAFQCIVNIGVRGSEQVRTRVVEADMVPVIATILDNYDQVLQKVKERQDLESRRRCPFGSSKSFARSSTREADQRAARSRRQAPPPIAIPDPDNSPEQDDPVSALSEVTPTGPTAALSLSSPPERTTFPRQHHHHRSHGGLAQFSSPSLGSSRQPSDPPLSAVPLHSNGDMTFGLRPVRDIDRLPSMVPTLHAELSSQPQSPTTPMARTDSPIASASEMRPRRRPSIRHQLSISGSDDDGQIDESPSEESAPDGQAEPIVGIQADIVMQDIVDEESLLEPRQDAVTLGVADVSSTDDDTFNITHRTSTDGSANAAGTPTQQIPFPQTQMPPPVNAVNATPPNLQQTPAWYPSRLNLDRSSAPPSILAAMPRDEDVLMSLQLLAYVSKYCNLRSYFQKSHLVPRLKIGNELRVLDPDYNPTTDNTPTQEELEDEWDNEFVIEDEFNIFPLIERFTASKSSSKHSSTPQSPQNGDMQYWAGVVMRNLCRKDDSRGGIRQCAYWQCGKWEEYTRQFAKCRRCRRTKYCSKECQKGAWGSHRFCQYLSKDTQDLGIRYEGSLTDQAAEKKVHDLLDGINSARDALIKILSTHGDLVLTRWSKKSKDKRTALLASTNLLEQVSPNPNDQPQPLDQWIKSDGKAWPGARWMSIKPFAEDKMRLLALLHVRTRHLPSTFALLDTRESMSSFGSLHPAAHQVYFNAKSVKMYRDEYGELTDWDNAMCHSWAYVGFPRACMTLEIQQDILVFLAEMVGKIILDAEGMGCSKWSALVQSGFHGSGSEALWGSYTTPALAPPLLCGFNPELALWKAEDRYRVVLDDIEAMQTAPQYMHLALRIRKASIAYDQVGTPSQDVRWSHLKSDLIQDTIQRLNMWHIVVLSCRDVCKVFEEHADRMAVGKPLPPEAIMPMNLLASELQGRLRFQSYVFDKLLPFMGPLKSRFRAYQSGSAMAYTERQTSDSTNAEDRLAYLLVRLQVMVTTGATQDLSSEFDRLERELLAQGSPYQVDKRMLDQLSDIMTMDELFQMTLYNQMGHGKADETAPMKSAPQMYSDRTSAYQKAAARLEPKTIDRIGRLMRQFSEVPWPKGTEDLVWLAASTESRKRLSAIWRALRDEIKRAQIASSMDMKRSAIDTIQFDTQPDFLAELEQERRDCEETSKAAKPQLSRAQTTWGSSSDESAPKHRKQTKAKASRTTDASSSDELDAHARSPTLNDASRPESSSTASHATPITVKQDSLSVFSKMYPMSGGDGGSVRWSQLVQAMVDAGLTATEAGGSAVSFSDGSGSMVFHKPHPDPVVDPIMLQSMGRRMRKWFGWGRERFEVRQKDA